MSAELENYIENLIDELEDRGYEVTDLDVNGDQVSLAYESMCGTKLKMTLNPKELGLI
jgi:hypothetical protein